MKKGIIITALTVIAILGLSVNPTSTVEITRAHASINATSAWNSVCANYGFNAAPSSSDRYTFAQNWPRVGWTPAPGMTCQQMLDACCSEVADLLGTPDPGFGDGDIFNASIQNWPE